MHGRFAKAEINLFPFAILLRFSTSHCYCTSVLGHELVTYPQIVYCAYGNRQCPRFNCKSTISIVSAFKIVLGVMAQWKSKISGNPSMIIHRTEMNAQSNFNEGAGLYLDNYYIHGTIMVFIDCYR